VYVPHLDPYPGYMPMRIESVDDAAYDELPDGDKQVCPERHSSIFSSTYISAYMT
jgi:ATP-binding cassette subfamily C (CFTR/MRP) protein 1